MGKYIYAVSGGLLITISFIMTLNWWMWARVETFTFQMLGFLMLGIFIIGVIYALNILEGSYFPEKLLKPYIILTALHLIVFIMYIIAAPSLHHILTPRPFTVPYPRDVVEYHRQYIHFVDILIPSWEIRERVIEHLSIPMRYRPRVGGAGGFWSILPADIRLITTLLAFHLHLYAMIVGVLAIIGIIKYKES